MAPGAGSSPRAERRYFRRQRPARCGADVTLRGVDAQGERLRIDDTGRIVVDRDGSVSVTGAGFAPGEVVDVWLFSTPVLLGSVTVAADGTFAGRLPMPSGVPTGPHTLQLNGTRADGSTSRPCVLYSPARSRWRSRPIAQATSSRRSGSPTSSS